MESNHNKSRRSSSRRPGSFLIPGALLLLSAVLFLFQSTTLAKLAVLSPGRSYRTLGNFARALSEQIAFDRFDLTLMLFLLAIVAGLIYLEARWEMLTSFFQSVFVSDRKTILLLLASSLVLVRYYFAVGDFNWVGDAPQHIVTAHMAALAIEHGELPIWTFLIGNGSPYLQHYGFLFPYLIGFVNLLLGDLSSSMKVVLASGHLLSGTGMYLLARRLCGSRRAGFVAGLGYVLCFWHLQQVLIMGRTPLGLYYGFLPWAFYFLEESFRAGRRIGAALLGGASVALLSFTHPAYGFYTCILLFLYAAIRLLLSRDDADVKGMIGAALLYMACALLFGAYMNVGMWVESAFTNMNAFDFGLKDSASPAQALPGPTWRHLLVWSNYRFWLLPPQDHHWYGGYLGVTLIALAAVGGLGLRLLRGNVRMRRYLPGFAALALVSSILVAYRWPPLNQVQLIQVFNPSRYLLFVVFFLALSAGVGSHLQCLFRPMKFRRSRGYTACLLLLLIDLGSTTFQQPYGKRLQLGFPQLTSLSENGPVVARGSIVPNFRAQWVTDGQHSSFAIARMVIDGKTPVPEVYHPGELPASAVFTDPLMYALRRVMAETQTTDAFAAHPWRDLLLRGLRLLNTRYVIATTRSVASGFSIEIENSPVVASPRIVPFESEPVTAEDANSEAWRMLKLGQLDSRLQLSIKNGMRMIQEMGLDPVRSVCDRILINVDGELQDLGTSPEVEVLEHTVAHHDVRLRVQMTAAGFVRLAYAYFPFLEVTVDGSAVLPMETADRFIALKLEEGEHDITIEARLSPLRRILLWLALAGFVVVGFFAWRERRISRAR